MARYGSVTEDPEGNQDNNGKKGASGKSEEGMEGEIQRMGHAKLRESYLLCDLRERAEKLLENSLANESGGTCQKDDIVFGVELLGLGRSELVLLWRHGKSRW